MHTKDIIMKNLTPSQKRKAYYKSNFKSRKKIVESKRSVKDKFSLFWFKKSKELKKNRDLEDVIWKHFKSYGYDKENMFEEGLKHFGIVQ